MKLINWKNLQWLWYVFLSEMGYKGYADKANEMKYRNDSCSIYYKGVKKGK